MNPLHLFLFEYISQNQKIVIYGLGKVGKDYIDQIERTHWCKIVGVCDQSIRSNKYENYTIEQLAIKSDYDFVVIAIRSLEVASRAYAELVRAGVDENRILNMHLRQDVFPATVKAESDNKNSNLKIAFKDGGGFGDLLIDYLLIEKVAEVLSGECHIALFSRYADYFGRFQQIDESLSIDKFCASNDFDIVIDCRNIAIIKKFNRSKVRGKSEKLYEYCDKYEYLYQNMFSETANNYRFTKYALLLGKNRIEQLDLYGILGLTRNARMQIPISGEALCILDKYGLKNKMYITINRDTGTDFKEHPKLWPTEYYVKLLREMKLKYPYILFILIGKEGKSHIKDYVDIDLTGKTTLEEITVILKYAYLHVGSEGGMVHLRHFLFGSSIVFWGATDVKVFGYDENINLFGPGCSEHCEWLVDNWMEGCIKSEQRYSCIKSVLPEMAQKAFQEYMIQRKTWKVIMLPYEGDEAENGRKWKAFTYHMPYCDNECDEKMIIRIRKDEKAEYLIREAARILAPGNSFLIFCGEGTRLYKWAAEAGIEFGDFAISEGHPSGWMLTKKKLPIEVR